MKFSYISKNGTKKFSVDFGIIRKWQKVAVISSADCYYFRKTYPKVEPKDLPAIVKNDDFGINFDRPYITKHKVREVVESGFVVDVWLFDPGLLDSSKYSYVIPEHGMFFSPEPEVSIYRDIFKDDVLHVVAHDMNGYISSVSLSEEEFGVEFEMFLRSLRRFGEIERINMFTEVGNIDPALNIKLNKVYRYDLPAFLIKTDISIIKQFREPFSVSVETGRVLRASVLFMLSVSGVNYLNMIEYKQKISQVDQQINTLDKNINDLMAKMQQHQTGSENSSSILNTLKQDIEIEAINVIEKILKKLPEKDYIVMYNQEEYKLTISVNSKNPVVTIKALSSIDMFENLKMVTAPIKQQDGSFNILIDIDLRKVDDGQK